MTDLKKMQFKDVPVVILCGGNGVLVGDQQGQRVNKGLLPVHGKALFFWVMHHYAMHGAADFILATGIQSERFSDALRAEGATPTREPGCHALTMADHECRVRQVATAPNATTAARLLACKPRLGAAVRFALTYSDTLSNVNLSEELEFHTAQGLVGTLVGTTYPVRLRILGIRQDETLVRAFAPRPIIESTQVNGGYYIFDQAIWGEEYGLSADVALENGPLERLAAAGQLAAFLHTDNWQHYDSERDLPQLYQLAQAQQAEKLSGVSIQS